MINNFRSKISLLFAELGLDDILPSNILQIVLL